MPAINSGKWEIRMGSMMMTTKKNLILNSNIYSAFYVELYLYIYIYIFVYFASWQVQGEANLSHTRTREHMLRMNKGERSFIYTKTNRNLQQDTAGAGERDGSVIQSFETRQEHATILLFYNDSWKIKMEKKNVEERKRTLDVSSLLARDGFFFLARGDTQNREWCSK